MKEYNHFNQDFTFNQKYISYMNIVLMYTSHMSNLQIEIDASFLSPLYSPTILKINFKNQFY